MTLNILSLSEQNSCIHILFLRHRIVGYHIARMLDLRFDAIGYRPGDNTGHI